MKIKMFDFSDYPEDSKIFDLPIKKWLVKWKMKSKEKLLVNLLD